MAQLISLFLVSLLAAAQSNSVQLAPRGVLAGRVTDPDGKPMAQAPVVWFQYAYVQGKKELLRLGSSQVVTNDQGEYRFANLPSGKYFIAAMISLPNVRSGGLSGTGVTQERNVITFFPNVIDPAIAIPVEVTGGVERADIDIHVRRAAVYSVRGKATADSRSAPQVRLELSRTDGVPGPPALTTVRPDGSFEFPYVLPGSYVLRPATNTATLITSNGPPISGNLDVRITDRNLDDLTLQLVPTSGGGINGTVRVEGSDLQAILKLKGTPQLRARDQIFVALREVEQNCDLAGGTAHPVNDNGAFKIEAVAAKKYSWCVKNLPPGTYVKSARFNDQDVTRKVIDTTNSGGGSLEIVISMKGADFEGAVSDDKGELKAGVMVTLWLKTEDSSNSNGGVYETATDQNGRFRLSGLAPGNYYAAALEKNLPTVLKIYPEFLWRFNGDATTITLEEGGHVSQNAKFISAKRIDAEIDKLP